MAEPETQSRWIRQALDEYEGRLIRYAARLSNDLDIARDAVQETFLRLVKAEREKVAPHLVEWLFAVCRSRVLDISRKEKRMKPLSDTRAAQAGPPEAALEQREEKGRVLAAVACLPGNQQEMIRLKFQEGLSYREISRVTRMSTSNVGYLIHTAIATLRNKLKPSN